jgi:hypothetical protein
MIASACQSEPSASTGGTVRTYGESVEEEAARSASEVASSPSALEGTTVRVTGRISTVCKKKGCWLALDTGTAMPIRVLVPRTDEGYEFTVPTTLTGQATVMGTLRTVELDAATQEHLILEYMPARTDDSTIIERESFWKRALLSRTSEFGYNHN